jgi:hypothetical protein
LLEKWGRKCAYCGVKDVPFEVEHLTPRSRGGSDRVSNLTLACYPYNRTKGNQTAEELGFPHLQKEAKVPLKDAAAVNATRWAIYRLFEQTGTALEVGTGGRTKYNRVKQGYGKTHWLDPVCVGESGAEVRVDPQSVPSQLKRWEKAHGRCVEWISMAFPERVQKGQNG